MIKVIVKPEAALESITANSPTAPSPTESDDGRSASPQSNSPPKGGAMSKWRGRATTLALLSSLKPKDHSVINLVPSVVTSRTNLVNQIIIEISKLAAHTPLENIYLSPQYMTLMKSKVKDVGILEGNRVKAVFSPYLNADGFITESNFINSLGRLFQGMPADSARHIFLLFQPPPDTKCIDFRKFGCTLGSILEVDLTQRISFCFAICDTESTGKLSSSILIQLLDDGNFHINSDNRETKMKFRNWIRAIGDEGCLLPKLVVTIMAAEYALEHTIKKRLVKICFTRRQPLSRDRDSTKQVFSSLREEIKYLKSIKLEVLYEEKFRDGSNNFSGEVGDLQVTQPLTAFPIDIGEQHILFFLSQKIKASGKGERGLTGAVISPVSCAITVNLFWYVYVTYFQANFPDAEKVFVDRLGNYYVELLQQMHDHPRLISFLLENYHFIAVDAIGLAFHYIFHESRKLYTNAFRISVLEKIHLLLTGLKVDRKQLEAQWKLFNSIEERVDQYSTAEDKTSAAPISKVYFEESNGILKRKPYIGAMPHDDMRRLRIKHDKDSTAKEMMDKANSIRRLASIIKLKKDIILSATVNASKSSGGGNTKGGNRHLPGRESTSGPYNLPYREILRSEQQQLDIVSSEVTSYQRSSSFNVLTKSPIIEKQISRTGYYTSVGARLHNIKRTLPQVVECDLRTNIPLKLSSKYLPEGSSVDREDSRMEVSSPVSPRSPRGAKGNPLTSSLPTKDSAVHTTHLDKFKELKLSRRRSVTANPLDMPLGDNDNDDDDPNGPATEEERNPFTSTNKRVKTLLHLGSQVKPIREVFSQWT